MIKEGATRGYVVLLLMVSFLIIFQALAIGRDDDSFEKPVLSISTSFRAADLDRDEEFEAPLELAPANFEPGALSSLPGEESETPPSCGESSSAQKNALSVEKPLPSEPSISSSSHTTAPPEAISSKRQSAAEPPVEESSRKSMQSARYTVHRGDSLWKIARRYGITVEALRSVNHIPSARSLKPGQELFLPGLASARLHQDNSGSAPNTTASVRYRVKPGDNLYLIAKKFKTSVASLLINNSIDDPERLAPGDELIITTANRIVHIVNQGESLWELANLYSVPLQKLIEYNNLRFKTIFPGQRLSIPVSDARTLEAFHARIMRRRRSKRRFHAPLHGRIADKFGWRIHPILKRRLFHCGLDIAARRGTAIKSVGDGKVTFAGWLKGYGKVVVIKHKNGFSSRYAHCQKMLVKVGESIKTGQIIAKVGTTGLSTGPHVHLEIRKFGRPVNPLDYVAI